MAEDKQSPSLVQRATAWTTRTLKTAVTEAVDSAFFGRVGALGASELANAIVGGGNPYAPTGPAQQPEEIDRDNGNNTPNNTAHQGVAVTEPQVEAPAPAEPQPTVHGPVDPLQRAAANARAALASAPDKSQQRGLEIG